jgi:tRNA G26 N,N-dimethylase Trm1
MLKKGHVPKLSAVIEKLEKSRFAASRTIFCKTGIKSNCDFEKMKTAL